MDIPLMNVSMWLCPYSGHRGNGQFITLYHQPQHPAADSWLMYVCTFAIGNLAIQVVAVKDYVGQSVIRPMPGFDELAIPFWPGLQTNYIWPGTTALRNSDDFKAFASRWKNIQVFS